MADPTRTTRTTPAKRPPRSALADLPAVRPLRDRFPWYLAVAENRWPAKYLLARRVPVAALRDLESAPTEALWAAHEAATGRLLATRERVRDGGLRLRDLPPASPNLLDLSVALVERMLRRCDFCRWNCRVDRGAAEPGKRGTCQLDRASRVASYFHHPGEEDVFRGTRGSGTVFLTSCNLRCGFCQNGDISQDKDNGTPFTPRDLAVAAWQLRREGAHNVNWVGGEPTIHLHSIVAAIAQLEGLAPEAEELARVAGAAKADGRHGWSLRAPGESLHEGAFNVPVLWNSNFFMSEPAMRVLRCLADVWLPDFKFGQGRCAVRLARTPWYWDTVTANLARVEAWGEDALVRHLVMPGHVDCCTRPVLDWLAAHAARFPVNVMDQFHPDAACDPASARFDPRLADLARRPRASEVKAAWAHAEARGLAWRAASG